MRFQPRSTSTARLLPRTSLVPEKVQLLLGSGLRLAAAQCLLSKGTRKELRSHEQRGGKEWMRQFKGSSGFRQEFSSFRKDNEIKQKLKEGQKYYGISIPNE